MMDKDEMIRERDKIFERFNDKSKSMEFSIYIDQFKHTNQEFYEFVIDYVKSGKTKVKLLGGF